MAETPRPVQLTLRGERAEQFERIEDELTERIGHDDLDRVQVWDFVVAHYREEPGLLPEPPRTH